jgi:hypothetical protein
MSRTAKIFAATVAALALTASLAFAAEAVNTQRDSGQTSPWQQCPGADFERMNQNGHGRMSAEGYGRMGQNGYGHMDQADFERMNQNSHGRMGGSSHMGF